MSRSWTEKEKKQRSQDYFLMYSQHPEYKTKIDEGVTKFWKNNSKQRKKYSSMMRKFWTKEQRVKQSQRKKAYFKKNPLSTELKKKIDKAVTRWWREHPNIKKQKSIELKEFFMKHPKDFMEKFANHKNNPFRPHIKTSFGLVRSKPEKIIADYLTSCNIKAEYEAKTIRLDGWPCVPDFYLPDYDTYIEFYGGYPGSYKKKVIKNKIYKKYKIKVISITPSELDKLDSVISFKNH